MSKKRIYIAGKVSGESKWDCTAKFLKAKQEVQALGCAAINPLEVVGTWEIPWLKAMKMALRAMLSCDAVYHLPCAKFSKGAQIELQLARDLQIPTFYDLETLKKRYETTSK